MEDLITRGQRYLSPKNVALRRIVEGCCDLLQYDSRTFANRSTGASRARHIVDDSSLLLDKASNNLVRLLPGFLPGNITNNVRFSSQ